MLREGREVVESGEAATGGEENPLKTVTLKKLIWDQKHAMPLKG